MLASVTIIHSPAVVVVPTQRVCAPLHVVCNGRHFELCPPTAWLLLQHWASWCRSLNVDLCPRHYNQDVAPASAELISYVIHVTKCPPFLFVSPYSSPVLAVAAAYLRTVYFTR
jgi:hypothetical protein